MGCIHRCSIFLLLLHVAVGLSYNKRSPQYRQARIVGGVPALTNEYPWYAFVTVNGSAVIGGTVIAKNWVLTAARSLPNAYATVAVGNQTVSATKIFRPPQNQFGLDSDLALLQLETPLQFGESAREVCLPFKFSTVDFDGQIVTAIGYGANKSDGTSLSSELRKVELPVYNARRCRRFATVSKYVSDNMICTYKPGKGLCHSDNGSPLNWVDPASGRVFTVGSATGSTMCGGTVLHAKVTNFLSWIQQTAGDIFCNP